MYLCMQIKSWFMKERNEMILDDLTKGNIWSVTESELANMLVEGKKEEDYNEMETHYMNIIRTVFDIQYLSRNDEQQVNKLEKQGYEIFSYPSEGDIDAIAIRKHAIKKITDLTLENIQHLDATEVLELIRRNMGTGWKGLSLSIQDVIESAFYVDYTSLPEATMHRAGGILERRKADGYDILEIIRGSWIEAIFMKAKPKVEKIKTDFTIRDDEEEDNDFDDDNDTDDDMTDIDDENSDQDDDLDEDTDEEIDNDNLPLEDIEDIEDIEDNSDE